MRIEDLDRARSDYRHVYLSPHLDDAALSCGGRIMGQIDGGQPALVVTFCTASPPAEGPFSALAQRFHADWGLPPEQVVAGRLAEDQQAMQVLGCDYHWADMLDAIYRYPEAYDSRESLFGAPAPDDPLFATLRRFLGELRARFPQATFYAPLGVGSHVDHLVTFAAVRETLGNSVWFYEDIHYVLQPGALEQRLDAIEGAPTYECVAIDDATLGRKITAIHAYASQLSELFGSAQKMEPAVKDYAHKVSPQGAEFGERVWRFVE
jgi:LmbE family N-acetylglucosaminyl deacetylase